MNNSQYTRLKPFVFAATAVLSIALLSACGQRGALYLPKQEQKTQSQPTGTKQAQQQKEQIKSQN